MPIILQYLLIIPFRKFSTYQFELDCVTMLQFHLYITIFGLNRYNSFDDSKYQISIQNYSNHVEVRKFNVS